MGHLEAKRLLMDEIERKRVSFLLHDDTAGRHYPTRAEMPKIFSIVEETKKLLKNVPKNLQEPRPKMENKVKRAKKQEKQQKLDEEKEIRESAKKTPEAQKQKPEAIDDLLDL